MLLLDWCSLRYESLRTLLDGQSIVVDPWCRKSSSAILGKECRISGFDDLPDEILLMIFRYLPRIDVLRVFNSNDPSDRFHRLILDYRTKLYLRNLRYADFRYLIDHIASESGVAELALSNSNIPCLIEHFLSLCQELPFDELLTLGLYKCSCITPALIAWITKQRKLERFYCDYFTSGNSVPPLKQRSLLRDLLFNNEIAPSLHTLDVSLSLGLVLSNRLPSRVIAQLYYVDLSLETFDDLCILLIKNFIPIVRELVISLDRRVHERM